MTKLNSSIYLDTIRETIANDGWKVADNLNKLSLENNLISQHLYSEAARLIVKAYIAANP